MKCNFRVGFRKNYFSMMMLCLLVLLFFLIHFSEGNHEAILCENLSVNLSCGTENLIEIQNIEFGSLLTRNNSNKSLNTSYIRSECDGSSQCQLNHTSNDVFETLRDVHRLVNVSNTCEFEYFGCFKDDKSRLLSGYSTSQTPMSAEICRKLCSVNRENNTYFGTQYFSQCFCGNKNDMKKVYGDSKYGQQSNATCSAPCKGNIHEKCGGSWLMSIYTTNTEVRQEIVELPIKTANLRCAFNAKLNINYVSYQTSNFCETENVSTLKENCRLFNDGICWVKNSVPKDKLQLQNILPKFIKINYICRGKDEIYQNASESRDKNILTGLSVGIVTVCLVCGIMVVICVTKRRTRSRKNGLSIQCDTGAVEYANFEGNELANSNEAYFSAQESNQIAAKSNNNDAKQTEVKQDSFDNIYADTVEGLYDVSNKPRYRNTNDQMQAIYSHTVDDVYDTAIRNNPKTNTGENEYGQGL